jgi:hypothetical protein
LGVACPEGRHWPVSATIDQREVKGALNGFLETARNHLAAGYLSAAHENPTSVGLCAALSREKSGKLF